MIILASYGLRSPIVSEKVREYIKNPEEMKVLIVPFAGFDCEKTAERETRDALVPFGFKAEDIFVCRKGEAIKEEFDLIYVPGGNPFKLIKMALEEGVMPIIKEAVKNGAVYFGASAGADFCCENLEYLTCVEDNDFPLESFEGLSLIEENVICHVDQRDYGTLRQVREFKPEKKLLMLRNDDIFVIE